MDSDFVFNFCLECMWRLRQFGKVIHLDFSMCRACYVLGKIKNLERSASFKRVLNLVVVVAMTTSLCSEFHGVNIDRYL